MSEPECTCWMTPPHMWLSAASCGYGSGYEPGSMWEWNPDCLAHPPSEPQATTTPVPAAARDTNRPEGHA